MSRKPYAATPMIQRIIRIFIDLGHLLNMKSYHPQPNIIRKILTHGPEKNMFNFTEDSFGLSLVSSFKASAIGWVSPHTSTLLGPLR